jgi:hypothetical protein
MFSEDEYVPLIKNAAALFTVLAIRFFFCFLCKGSGLQQENYASIFLLPLLTDHG